MVHDATRWSDPGHDALAEILELKRKNRLLQLENDTLALQLERLCQQTNTTPSGLRATDDTIDRLAAMRHLVMAAEYKDHDTGAHLVRIGYFSSRLAPACGCDEELSRLMLIASTMHDIGKIGIPDCILKKYGSLTTEERRFMQRHAEFGARLLSRSDSPMLRLASEIALSHHERFDGTGYPRGLRGEEIPLSGRIVAVADVFDALVMDRAYRPAMPVSQALAIIHRGSGTHFDPNVVDAFFTVVDEILDMCERIQDDEPPGDLEWIPSARKWEPFDFYDRPLRSSRGMELGASQLSAYQ